MGASTPQPGQRVYVQVEGIGVIDNRVVAEQARFNG
jgi:hypothetical protein